MFSPRNPPQFTRTLYDSHILWDSHLLWNGVTVIDPTWSERSPVTSNFTPRTGPQTLYTWGTATFPILMKKGYYYRVVASATVNGPTSTASINYIQ